LPTKTILRAIKTSYQKEGETELNPFSLEIDAGERLGILGSDLEGRNRVGKILSGQLKATHGKLRVAKGLRGSYLPRAFSFRGALTIKECFEEMNPEAFKLIRGYQKFIKEYSVHTGKSPDALQLLNQEKESWVQKLKQVHAAQYQRRLEALMQKIPLERDLKVEELPKAWKKKILYLRSIFYNPHLLYCEHPIDSLDVDSADWITNELLHYKGALIINTDDRELLDKLGVKKILEVHEGEVSGYPGPYQKFTAAFIRHMSLQKPSPVHLIQADSFQREIAKIRRDEAREAGVTDQTERPVVFSLKGITYALGDEGGRMISELNLDVKQGEKIGIFGPQGVGKTTLLKLIYGQSQPIAGQIEKAEKFKTLVLDPSRVVLEMKKTAALQFTDQDHIYLEKSYLHISGFLEKFQIFKNRQNILLSEMTEGELMRLKIAAHFKDPPDLLLIDDWIDQASLDLRLFLEDYLSNLKAVVLFCTSDRKLLHRLASRCLVLSDSGLEGKGRGSVVNASLAAINEFRNFPPLLRNTRREEIELDPIKVFGIEEKQEIDQEMLKKKVQKLEKELQEIETLMSAQGGGSNVDLLRQKSKIEKQLSSLRANFKPSGIKI